MVIFPFEPKRGFWYDEQVNITRQQQVLSNIKRIVSVVLHEMNHELFHNVVVHSVHLSNDQRECRVWVDAPEKSIEVLNTKYRGEIQHAFMKQYNRKIVPRLVFILNLGDVERMEELLADKETNEQK